MIKDNIRILKKKLLKKYIIEENKINTIEKSIYDFTINYCNKNDLIDYIDNIYNDKFNNIYDNINGNINNNFLLNQILNNDKFNLKNIANMTPYELFPEN